MLPVETPFKTYTGLDGKPLDNGYVYFGLPNQDPIAHPVTVYWDADGTLPAAQPLRTVSGYIMNAGTPANVFFDGAYSELVNDSKGRQVFYVQTSESFSIATLVLGFAKSAGSSLIGFIQAGAGAIMRTVQDKLRERKTVLDFMTEDQRTDFLSGAPALDHTAAFTAGFAACDVLRAPAGTFNVTSFTIPAGKKLLTDGGATVFQQIAGQPLGTRVIVIGGSNVEVGSLTVKGNIAGDPNEQQHGVFVNATATTGNLTNIKIGDITGVNIRGDVVYIGQATGYTVSNVHVGDVVCNNVYRNGVSIVSGDSIKVDSVTGTAVGFCHLDIEPNVGSGPATNIRVGYVKGRILGLIGPTANDYVGAVEIGIADLNPANAGQSVPAYAPGGTINDGLLLRNLKSARIGCLNAEGFNRGAIFTTYNGGELGAEMLEIGALRMRNCSLTDNTYNSFVQADHTRFSIGYVDVVVAVANKRAFDALNNSDIGAVKADISAGAVLLQNASDCRVMNVVQTGANGFLLKTCQRISVKGGSFTGDYLATFSDDCAFENFTATAAVLAFTAGREDHTIINSTLTVAANPADYYAFGTGIRNFSNTLRFGAYQLWVDAAGKLRIKNGAPTTDLDGTVVGTQA